MHSSSIVRFIARLLNLNRKQLTAQVEPQADDGKGYPTQESWVVRRGDSSSDAWVMRIDQHNKPYWFNEANQQYTYDLQKPTETLPRLLPPVYGPGGVPTLFLVSPATNNVGFEDGGAVGQQQRKETQKQPW